MRRLEYLNRLKAHPMIGKDFDRLNKQETQWLTTFVVANSALTLDQYATRVNRMSVTDEVIRRQNRTRVWALLLEAVTLEFNESINRA